MGVILDLVLALANWYYFHEKNDKLSYFFLYFMIKKISMYPNTLITILYTIFREIQNLNVNQSYIFKALFLPTASEDMFEICNGTRQDRINSIQDKI